MENNTPKRKEDVRDPIGRRGWPEEKGRDGERLQCSGVTQRCGFPPLSLGFPFRIPTRPTTWRLSAKDPESVLNFYKQILALRHKNEALTEGSYVPLEQGRRERLAYLRKYEGKLSWWY